MAAERPITFAYAWLRCNTAGGECVGIPGATGRSYRLTSADVDHKLRVNVTARNAIGRTTVLSSESGVVGVPLPPGAIRLPNGRISIPVTSVPADQRLVVSQVGFTPNPVASRRGAITVRVLVKDTRGYVVRDAGSLNGTYLNRQRVESAPLADGDELQIGTFKLVFLTGRGDAT